MSVNEPKTYLDRDVTVVKNYFFVSYSHADKEIVYEILNELYAEGANYWYDRELAVGDIWSEKAKSALFHSSCIGVLWFISENSIISDAVKKEIESYQQRKADYPSFKLLSVSLKGKKILDYLKDFPDISKELFDKINFYLEISGNSALIFDSYINTPTTVKNLLNEFRKVNASQDYTLNIRDSDLEHLDNFSKRFGEFFLDAGEYETDIEFDKSFKEPRISKGLIMWKLIYSEANKFYFVACKCIDFATLKSVDAKIIQLEKDLKKELPYVECVRLIPEDLIEKYREIIGYNLTTQYADYKRLQPLLLFWAESKNGSKVFYNVKNIKIKKDNLDINAGIRPMLVIDGFKIHRRSDI